MCRNRDSPPTVPKSRALTARHTPISVPRKELRGGTSVGSLEEETSAETQGTFQQISTPFSDSGVFRFALLTSFFKFTFLGISQMTRLYLHHFQPSFLPHLFPYPTPPSRAHDHFVVIIRRYPLNTFNAAGMHIRLGLTPQDRESYPRFVPPLAASDCLQRFLCTLSSFLALLKIQFTLYILIMQVSVVGKGPGMSY